MSNRFPGLHLVDPTMLQGPGGITSPGDISGLIRWWDAESYAGGYVDGNTVTTNWTDDSATSDDAVIDAVNRPVYKDTVLGGGKSSLQMPSVPANQSAYSFTQVSLASFTAVLMLRATVGRTYGMLGNLAGNYQFRMEGTNPGELHMYMNVPPELSTGLVVGINQVVWYVGVWRRTGTTPDFRYNKTTHAEKDGDTQAAAYPLDILSGYQFNTCVAYDLAEIALYNAYVTDADLDSLYDNYFKVKYAADLP